MFSSFSGIIFCRVGWNVLEIVWRRTTNQIYVDMDMDLKQSTAHSNRYKWTQNERTIEKDYLTLYGGFERILIKLEMPLIDSFWYIRWGPCKELNNIHTFRWGFLFVQSVVVSTMEQFLVWIRPTRILLSTCV